MGRVGLWLSGVLVGVIVIVASALGMIAVLLSLLLAVPLLRRRDGRVALSGLLTGFGFIWLALIGAQLASGGTTENLPFWVFVGALLLVAGLGLLAAILLGNPTRGHEAGR